MITQQDRNNVRRIFQKAKADTAPLLQGRADALGIQLDPQMPNIIAAQNALRLCMEVVFNECIPYNEAFLCEMAARMAAYAISAGPIESHGAMTDATLGALPVALANKIKEGAVIRSSWMTDGVSRPNIPARRELQ